MRFLGMTGQINGDENRGANHFWLNDLRLVMAESGFAAEQVRCGITTLRSG